MTTRARGRAPLPPSSTTGLQTLVGSTLLQRVDDPAHAPLRIGAQRWTQRALALQVGVVNTRAAHLLSKAADSIGAKNLSDLYQKSTPYTFAGIEGLGATTMYVLWRLFESAGLDPDAWASAGERDDALVSFVSLKKREQDAAKRERDDAKRRRRSSTPRATTPEVRP